MLNRPALDVAVPAYLRNLRMLTVHDEEYSRLSYMLRAALASISVNLVSIHAINSPQQDATFEANHRTTTVLDAWVNSQDLPADNTVPMIVSHGGRYRIPDANKGAVFNCGVIGIEPGDVPPGPQRYEFLLCRVAVGRSFVVDPAQLGTHGIPSGYDSITVQREQPPPPAPASGSQEGQEAAGQPPTTPPPVPYFREYVLNDESRIYPAYVVTFVFDATHDRIKAVPVCVHCEQRPAVLYCVQDNARLCPECDRELHSRSRVYERHQRVPLNEMQTSVGMAMCPEHPSLPLQFFDPVAHVALCVQCKMSGSHSTGEYASHALVSLAEAHQRTLEDAERERIAVEGRRQAIRAQLASIERRMAAVTENHERCQQQIFDIVQRAVQVLHEETQSKLSALLSDDTELRRQLEFYAWLEAFLQYQRGVTNPIEFLQIFKAHSAVLGNAPSEIVDWARDVKADIRIQGKLEVVVDDTHGLLPPSSPLQQQQQQQQQQPALRSALRTPGSGGGAALPQHQQQQQPPPTFQPQQQQPQRSPFYGGAGGGGVSMQQPQSPLMMQQQQQQRQAQQQQPYPVSGSGWVPQSPPPAVSAGGGFGGISGMRYGAASAGQQQQPLQGIYKGDRY